MKAYREVLRLTALRHGSENGPAYMDSAEITVEFAMVRLAGASRDAAAEDHIGPDTVNRTTAKMIRIA
jgi:hypothetical protein